MTTEYGIDLKPTPNYSGNPITIADEMLSSYEILTGKNQPYPKAIVKFDRSLYESESSWSNNTLPEIIDGQSLLSIRDGPYGHFYDYVIAKHTTSDLYVSFECYDSAYLLKTTELSDILLPPVPIGYLDARVPMYFKAVGNLSLFSQYYIFVPTTSLKSTDSSPLIYSADIYLSIPVTRVSSPNSARYTLCMLHGTIQLMNSSQPDSGVQFLITSIDRFHGDLASLFILCCAFVRRDCFTYLTPQTITTSETYPNNWLLNETVGWSSTPSNFHEESRSLVALNNSPISGLQSVGTFSEKEQYYGYLVVSSSTSSRVQYDYVTAQNVDQIVTIDTTVAYEVAKPAVDFEIRTNEFAASVLTALAESYNMLYFFASVYNTYRRSDGYLLPKTPNTNGYSATNILFTKNMSSLTTDVNYIRNKLLNISPSRTITLDYTNSTVDFLTAPQISNQGTGDLVTSVTVASENYQGSMSYTNAPFRGKSNNIYVPYIDQDNEKGTIEEIQENLTYAKKFLKRIAYNILRSNKADQNMCSYSTQELQPKIISVETLPISDIDTNAIYSVLNLNTMGETCYKRNGSAWEIVTPTFTYSDPFPYDFATINDVINGKTLTSVPLAALHTRYPECTTTWLWGYPPYLDTESSLNDLTKSSLVSAEQGTENITISENYAARIIVGDSDPDELPPSDPSTGNRLYDPTNQSLGGFTGLIQERNEDSGIYRLAGYDNGIVQAQFRTDGKITAGQNNVLLDADGLTVLYDASSDEYRAQESLKYIEKGSVHTTNPIVPFRMYYVQGSSILDAQAPATDLSLRYGDGAVGFGKVQDDVSINGYRTDTSVTERRLGTLTADSVNGTNALLDGDMIIDAMMTSGYTSDTIILSSSDTEPRVTYSSAAGYFYTNANATRITTNDVSYNVPSSAPPFYLGCFMWYSPVQTIRNFHFKGFFSIRPLEITTIEGQSAYLESAYATFTVSIPITENVSGIIYLYKGSSLVNSETFTASSTVPNVITHYLNVTNTPFDNSDEFRIEVQSTDVISDGMKSATGALFAISVNVTKVVCTYEYYVPVSGTYYQTTLARSNPASSEPLWSLTSDSTRILRISNINLDNWKGLFIGKKITTGSGFALLTAPITENTVFYIDTDGIELIIGALSDTGYGTDGGASCTISYNVYNGQGGQISLDPNGSSHYGKSVFNGDLVLKPVASNLKGSALFDTEVFYLKSDLIEVISPATLISGAVYLASGIDPTDDSTRVPSTNWVRTLIDSVKNETINTVNDMLTWKRVWSGATNSGNYSLTQALPSNAHELMFYTVNTRENDQGLMSHVIQITSGFTPSGTTLWPKANSDNHFTNGDYDHWNTVGLIGDDGEARSYTISVHFSDREHFSIVAESWTALIAIYYR